MWGIFRTVGRAERPLEEKDRGGAPGCRRNDDGGIPDRLQESSFSLCDGWWSEMGCSLVTWPIPLVTPSLKSTLAPTFRYSGCLMNLKRTTAFSPVLSSSCRKEEEIMIRTRDALTFCRYLMSRYRPNDSYRCHIIMLISGREILLRLVENWKNYYLWDSSELSWVDAPTFPYTASTVAVCLTFLMCTVTWKPLWKVLAWKSSTISASNFQQIVGSISGLTITIPYQGRDKARSEVRG